MKQSSAINEKLCQGKDVFERMNYLYQASVLMSSKNPSLASYYGSQMSGCAKKAVLRIEHNIKRSVCKVCHTSLIPGQTSTVRLMSRNRKMVRTKCMICKNVQVIPFNKKHDLWFDQPHAVLETFEYYLHKKKNNDKSDETRHVTDDEAK